MPRAPRLRFVALATVASLWLAACGVSSGELATTSAATPTTTRSAPADAPTTTEGKATTTTEADNTPTTAPSSGQQQAMVDAYVEMGFTEDEAGCLAEHITGGAEFDPTDTTQMMDLINECDISMTRLMDITESLGGGDMNETMKNSLAAGLRASGLTDEQADCVAGAYVDTYGTDTSKASDPTALLGLFSTCGIDPTQLGG